MRQTAEPPRLVRLARRRRPRRHRPAHFGKEYSSDEAGDGPPGRRRRVEDDSAEEVALRLQEVEVHVNRRLVRQVRANFLRRALLAWRRWHMLRQICEALESLGVSFPIESAEEAATALYMLHEHRGYTWVVLESVFQVTQVTLSRFARRQGRAGVRVSNLIISALNVRWQERTLEDTDAMPVDYSAEECAICLMDFEAADIIVGCPAAAGCVVLMHNECLREALRRDPRCPNCRGEALAQW